MTTPSKAERIRALLDEGILSHAEIANKIGVLPEYVRSVKQRQDQNSWYNRARMKGDRKKARHDGRLAYREAVNAGFPPSRAHSKYGMAYRNSMVKSGSKSVTP